MNITVEQIASWLGGKENERLEFKEAKTNFHFDKLVKYCAALANEGGGSIVLGVTDSIPRRVVGTAAFKDLERAKAGLIERLRLRIVGDEVSCSGRRVLVFTAPPHPIGVPIAVDGAYWMRAGEDLVPMMPDMLRRIFDEAGPDFSAQVCPQACWTDLAPPAIAAFRERWRFYVAIGKRGEYTRRKGLDRDTNKALLVKHITDNAADGVPLGELRQVLPAKSRSQIQVLLRELAKDGKVHLRGATRAGRWFPGPAPVDCNSGGKKLQ